MSLTGALERISDIQTQIQQLVTPPVDAPAASTTSPASATDFAAEINNALASTATDVVTGADIVEQAKTYLGVPYVFGGEDRSGMDCSGLVQRVLADLGIDAPRVVQDQADIGVEVPSLDQAQPGDLLVVKGEGHIVIYAGDGKIIHAPRPGKNVQLVDNYLSPSEISTIRRVVPNAVAPQTMPLPGLDAAALGTPGITSPSLLSSLQTESAQSQLLTLLRSDFLSQAAR